MVHDNEGFPTPSVQRGRAFPDGELPRTHALLSALLPASLLPYLPTSPGQAYHLASCSASRTTFV